LTALSAGGRPAVAGRLLDDDVTVLLRFENGAMGSIAASQIAIGEANGMQLSIYGDKGAAYWTQATGNTWAFVDVEGKRTEVVVKDAPVPTASPKRFTEPYGDDEAYIAALAEAYRDFAQTIIAMREGKDYTMRCVGVDEALRVATFNELASRSVNQSVEASLTKWMVFDVPKVALLT
jgi:predicted dehydrogenase